MTLKELISALGCSKYPERWESIYSEAVEIYESQKNPLLDTEYYDTLHEKYGVFENTLEIYKRAASLVAKKKELSIFFCLLCSALRDRANILNDLTQVEMPVAPDGEDTLPYDMLTALAICQSYPDVYAKLCAHNVSGEILYETMRIPERCVEFNTKITSKPHLTSFDWYQLAYDGKLFRIGRLQLEFPMGLPNLYKVFGNEKGDIIALANMRVHRDGFALGSRGYEDEEGSFTATIEETEDTYIGYPFDFYGHVSKEKIALKKSEWELKLQGGDKVVSLHVPPNEPFGEEIIDNTVALSREFMKNHYPEYDYKAFFCSSWLLDHAIIDLLGKDANTAKFSARFTTCGVKSAGVSTFTFVFRSPRDVKIEDLPENSSLQRILKKHYLDGKSIYEMHGFFF